jgi:hypothetical protein
MDLLVRLPTACSNRPLREALPYERRQIRTHWGYGFELFVTLSRPTYGNAIVSRQTYGNGVRTHIDLSSLVRYVVRLDRSATTARSVSTKDH